MVSNQESLRLRDALRQRARELGWHDADIDVIDADLGLSGASAAHRSGFKELVGRVGLSEVGLILSIDVTRLARNCSDWYPLLDICGLRGCLIADRDGVYDPGSPNGRLLLGLKGTISELELHSIRSRLTAGLIAKARRGELALTLPVGLVRDPSGVVLKEPNVAVQERLSLVFQLFPKLRTVAAVMRTLNDRGLELPRRDRHGDLCWARATVAAVASILKTPAYAGAFVHGRTRIRAATREDRSPAKVARPIDDWRIVVKDRYPACVDWPSHEKIRGMVSDNRAEYMRTRTRGAPREGELLLHGIARVARGAVTRCMSVTRAAASMSATTCAHMRACPPASTFGPHVWTPPSPTPSWPRWPLPSSMPCRAPAGPRARSMRRCGPTPNARSSVRATPPPSLGGSSIVSIRTTASLPPNWNGAGNVRSWRSGRPRQPSPNSRRRDRPHRRP